MNKHESIKKGAHHIDFKLRFYTIHKVKNTLFLSLIMQKE